MKFVCQLLHKKESLNSSQMHVTRKTRDVRTWKKTLFSLHLYNNATLVSSAYQCVETHSIEVCLTVLSAAISAAPLFQLLRHQWKLSTEVEPLYSTNISQSKQETFLYEYHLWVFENRVLRRIFVPKRDEETGGWRELHNEELHNLYSLQV
jgi:hypothetical protein